MTGSLRMSWMSFGAKRSGSWEEDGRGSGKELPAFLPGVTLDVLEHKAKEI